MLQGSYYHFKIWWVFRKLGLHHFGRVVTTITKKIVNIHLVFRKISKNCQNERIFEVIVMGWRKSMNWKIMYKSLSSESHSFFFKKRLRSPSSMNCQQLKSFGTDRRKQLTVQLWWPLQGPSIFRFSAEKIKCGKKSAND